MREGVAARDAAGLLPASDSVHLGDHAMLYQMSFTSGFVKHTRETLLNSDILSHLQCNAA